MSPRSSLGLVPETAGRESASSAVHGAVAVYAGAVAGALALTAGSIIDGSGPIIAAATVLAVVLGTVGGWAASSRRPSLPNHLGRTRVRRAAVVGLAVPFALIALASIGGPVGTSLGLAGLASASAIALAGQWLSSVARTCAVAVTVPDEPLATSRWQPPRSPVLDRLLLVMWPGLAVLYATGGEWFMALAWAALGIAWALSGLIEGRFRLGETGTDPEIRLSEDGLVKQRPYSAVFISWDDVDHVRLREGELVLERGLFDVRFEQGNLEAPEDLLSVIDGQLSPSVVR